MDDLNDTLNSSVGFLYKTMLERDPRKRRVKPVQPHLLQLDFAGLDNSSDDSDFKVGDESDDDDDGDDDEDEEDEDGDHQKDDDDNASISSSDSSSSSGSGSVSSKPSDSSKPSVVQKAPAPKPIPVVHPETKTVTTPFETAITSASVKKLKVSVCCVCLGDYSVQENEIVECDSCGASVHESCYGITEVESVGSSASSASTEPWFCDSCKAGIKPRCELCPNSGGIFKETDAGKWVHLVCALYIPGVAFGDVDRLSMVTLFEMSYAKWGSKECCLCDDERFARTGVCIGCDAGLCRSHFHVTCAQKEGLLTEASPDEDIADPFFAYCKQHADKTLVRTKRRNWLAVQSNMRNFESRLSEKEKLRVQKKLSVHQQAFAIRQETHQASWVPTVKTPRMLQTSAYAVSQLLKKAELLGLAQVEPGSDARKKSHSLPMLSSEFAVYYNERNVRIGQLQRRVDDLKVQREKLQAEETLMHSKYEILTKDLSSMEETYSRLLHEGECLWNIVTAYASKRTRWSGAAHFQRSPRSSPKKTPAIELPSLLQRCDTCKKTHDQHLLAKCDNCFKYHHLSCLDPPLTRMPKKTKQQGWQCSRCVGQSASEEEAADVDLSQPRKLREKVRDPMKYTYMFKEPRWPRKSAPKRSRAAPAVEQDGTEQCKVCQGAVDANNGVKCDKCCRSLHLGCLVPPRTRTPRVRGYVWFCDDCQRNVTAEVEPIGAERPQLLPSQLPSASNAEDSIEQQPLSAERSPSKSDKSASPNSPSKKSRLSRSPVSKFRTDSHSPETLATKRVRRVTIKGAAFALPKVRHVARKKDVGKLSTNIVRRALATGRRRGKNPAVERTRPVKRLKKPTACKIKIAVDREFFYSSRNDPMRRPFPQVPPNVKGATTVTDDESG